MSSTRQKSKPAPDDYLRLVRDFPLKPIRSPRELEAAIDKLTELTLGGEMLRAGEHDYRDALAILVAEYEQNHAGLQLHTTPLQRLQFLVRESGMTVNQLGEIVGSQPMASLILSGKRELSKANIRAIAGYFKVNPGYFL